MSRVWIPMIVLALLALAVMPAMAATGPVSSGDPQVITVEATVPEYINLDAEDLDITFQALTATATGYVVATDEASYTVSTNKPFQILWENGSDLTETGGYALDLEVSGKTGGMIDWTGGTTYAAGGLTWTPWGGCGTIDTANGGTDAGEDTGTFAFAGCQTFTFTNRAQLYQNGINDPAGAYSQATKLLLTINVP